QLSASIRLSAAHLPSAGDRPACALLPMPPATAAPPPQISREARAIVLPSTAHERFPARHRVRDTARELARPPPTTPCVHRIVAHRPPRRVRAGPPDPVGCFHRP